MFAYAPMLYSPAVASSSVTWNPSDKGGNVVLAGGNLTVSGGNTWTDSRVRATSSQNSGIRFYEFVYNGTNGGNDFIPGIATGGSPLTPYNGQDANSWGWQMLQARVINNNSFTAYGATATSSPVVGVLMNFTTGILSYYLNGVAQGTAFSGLSGTFFPMVSCYCNSGVATGTARFASSSWTNAPGVGETEW